MDRIVVGVDGSEHSHRALRWAVEEARLRGAEVEVVHAGAKPEVSAWPAVLPTPSHEDLVEAGNAVVDEVLEAVDTDGVTITREVRPSVTADLLCDRALDADLVVVGARGLGGFRGLMLGSVTQHVVAHSPRPVVVVVPEDRTTDESPRRRRRSAKSA
jgi:nucleotide-binding universal stress UspA family protein